MLRYLPRQTSPLQDVAARDWHLLLWSGHYSFTVSNVNMGWLDPSKAVSYRTADFELAAFACLVQGQGQKLDDNAAWTYRVIHAI